MSDTRKAEPRRALLTSNFPESKDQQLGMILHDARNKLCAIVGLVDFCMDQCHSNESRSVLASLSESKARLEHLLKSAMTGEIEKAECMEEMIKFRTNISSTLMSWENIEIPEGDVYNDFGTLHQGIAELEQLLKDAQAYMESTQASESAINTNIANVVGPLVESYQRRFPGVRFHIDLQSNPTASIYPNSLKRALENLLLNAVQAMPQNEGEIRIRITGEVIQPDSEQFPGVDSGRYCLIEVVDNGTGISPGVMTSILEKKITTKETGSGIGLASVCHSIRTHRGHLIIESEEGQYTRVTALIPSTIPPASQTVVKEGAVVEEDEISEAG